MHVSQVHLSEQNRSGSILCMQSHLLKGKDHASNCHENKESGLFFKCIAGKEEIYHQKTPAICIKFACANLYGELQI